MERPPSRYHPARLTGRTVPSVYDLKPRFQALLRPGVAALARAGVTANQVTVAAALLSLAAGAVIALLPDRRAPLLLLPLVLLLRMALNAVDGMLAREHGQKSRLGALLNELGDVVADAALYLPLALVPGFRPWLVVAVVLLAALTEMSGVLGPTIGASRRYDGPAGKSDRALVFGAVGLALGVGVPAGRWLDVLLAILALATAWTVVNRARRALAEPAPGPA
ncbi:MAG TPA: CDP-alcohol phosphatidyltransferase family protein [Thermoanaerobaculia bacterium]|nr:CDP-alcohol phosphatidyltransferase family protein [Thermoanaerobaculia bacterium]